MDGAIAGDHGSPPRDRWMRLWVVAAVVGILLLTGPRGAAQDGAPPSPPNSGHARADGIVPPVNAPGARPSTSTSAPCAANASQLDFLYPKIPASFVGGTIAGMPLRKGPLRHFNLFQADQFRVNGAMAIGSCNMVFAFSTRQKRPPAVESDAMFQVVACNQVAGHELSSEGARLCNSEPVRADGKTHYALQIPYGEINVLARGRKGPGELNSDTATYLTAATAVVTTILATVSNTQDKELAFGATVMVASAAYFFLIRRPSQGENYVAVFVRKAWDERKKVQAEAQPLEKVKTPESELLQRGDVLIFRIANPHDYFNISMILSGKTGLTFVSQGAEKGK
jgi:hypothetical protein